MNWTDLYSNTPSRGPAVQTRATATSGPNQSIVTGVGQSLAMGTAPAFSWLGLVFALILLRVIIAMGGRVST